MNERICDPERKKKILKIVGLTLASTAASVFATLVAVQAAALLATRKVQLKDCLRELFPGYDWEFTGIYRHLNQIKYRVYCPEGFLMQYPDAEETLRACLLERYPTLSKVKFGISFLPLSEFPVPAEEN